MHEVQIQCENCRRGVVHVGGFGYPCSMCNGKGGFTIHEIATRIDEWPATVAALLSSRPMRRSTGARLTEKLVNLIEELSKGKTSPSTKSKDRQGNLFP